MGLEGVIKDGVEYTAAAFTTGIFLHCFFDEKIKVTRKNMPVIFVLVVAISFLDILLQKCLGWNLILIPAFFLCTAITLQWNIETDLAAFFKRLFWIIGTEVALAVYSLELVMLGGSLAGIEHMPQKAGMTDVPETMAFYLTYIATILLIGVILYFLLVRRGTAMLFRGSDMILTITMGIIILLSLGLYLYVERTAMQWLFRMGMEGMLLLLLVLMPILIFKNRQSAYFNDMSARNESYLEAELAASRQYRDAQEETRAFRHDMRNNLNLLAELMRKKEYEKAESYIADLTGGLAELSPRIVTGDDMLDSLISSKLAELEKKNIALTVDGVIEGGLNWKPIDICAVFANAIDNAAQACEQMPEEKERYIRITFRKTQLQRVISIINSTAETVEDTELLSGKRRYTTKKDKSNHGFGLGNIRRTAEKYGGIVKISAEENEFRLTIVLT